MTDCSTVERATLLERQTIESLRMISRDGAIKISCQNYCDQRNYDVHYNIIAIIKISPISINPEWKICHKIAELQGFDLVVIFCQRDLVESE